MLLPVHAEHPEPRKIARAVEVLEKGGLVAYPTDSVYGIGCDMASKGGIERLYEARGLPVGKPLALLCPDLSDIAKYAIVENPQYRVLKRYLPGPYVFILPATREVPKLLLTKQKTVGIRVPSHPVTQALVRALGRPVLNTTAVEPEGGEGILDPWTVESTYPGVDVVIDAETSSTLPTTVIDLSQGDMVIVREGAGPILED